MGREEPWGEGGVDEIMVMDDDEITFYIFTRRHSGSSRMIQFNFYFCLLFAYNSICPKKLNIEAYHSAAKSGALCVLTGGTAGLSGRIYFSPTGIFHPYL